MRHLLSPLLVTLLLGFAGAAHASTTTYTTVDESKDVNGRTGTLPVP